MRLNFECDCGYKDDTKVTYESEFGALAIRFKNGTTFSEEESGYFMDRGFVYIKCGQCGKEVEVAG